MTATAASLPRPPVPIRWLRRVYENVEDGWVTVFSQDRSSSGERHTDWAHVTNIDSLTPTIADRAKTSCVWFGVATRKERLAGGRRGGIDDCLEIPALWVDIDIAGPNHAAERLPTTENEARHLITSYPIPPTVVIATGGGIQPWWFLSDPISADSDGAELLARWGATWAHHANTAGYHLDNVFNVDRVMRLPGTQNRKHEPILVDALESNWTRRYTAEELDAYTIDPPTPPTPLPTARLPYIGPKRPGDAFNATRSGNDILPAAGFTPAHSDRNGDQHWCRPGKTPREGHGATVYADGHTTIWSDTVAQWWPAVETRRPYDPFGLYTVLFHAGDFTAASDELERQGYGTKAIARDDLSWANLLTVDPATGEILQPPDTHHLPDEFWRSRPVFEHIRQAARSRRMAPDAVLGAVLTRIAACTPHTVEIPAVVGVAMGLTFYVGVTGPSSAGKSGAAAVAAELLPAPSDVLDRVPIGSGEGMVEILFDYVDEEGENGKKRKVKRQTRHAAIFYIDEGAVLSDLANRQGTTLLPTLRTAFTHGTLGNANASAERKRILDGRSYIYGITLGIQPELAGPLLADTAAGTPQRFIWVTATDPTAPDARPTWPGPLDWEPPSVGELEPYIINRGGWRRHQLDIDDLISKEIDTDRVAVMRGATPAAGDEHRMLVRLKTAALLTLLDRRLAVTVDDWELADTIVTTSRSIRRSIEGTLALLERGKEEAHADRLARRELHVEDSREQRALASATKSIANAVFQHHEDSRHVAPEGCSRGCARNAVAGSHKQLIAVPDAITEALNRGFIVEKDGRLLPGDARPA